MPIPLGRLCMVLPIALLVIGMSGPPFFLAIADHLRILGVALDLVAVILSAAPELATGLAADCLLRPVGRGLETLLAIAAAACGEQTELLRPPFSRTAYLEPFIESLLSPPDGNSSPLIISAGKMLLSYTGADTLVWFAAVNRERMVKNAPAYLDRIFRQVRDASFLDEIKRVARYSGRNMRKHAKLMRWAT